MNGQCRYCRCTEDRPCTLPNGEAASWFTDEQDLCNAPACLSQYFDDEAKAARDAHQTFLRNTSMGTRRRRPKRRAA